jgi:hypothetical protein
VKEGVAVAILSELDKTNVVLFTLILVVCVLFAGNTAAAIAVPIRTHHPAPRRRRHRRHPPHRRDPPAQDIIRHISQLG